jgi:hypothetical protein
VKIFITGSVDGYLKLGKGKPAAKKKGVLLKTMQISP